MARARRSRASSAPPQDLDPARGFLPQRHPPRAWLASALALTFAWALIFFPQLFLGERFAQGDAAAFRPFAEFSRARWHESHQRTYWNPYVFMGIESVASLADPRPQYLPDRLLDLTERLSEPKRSPQLWLLLTLLAGTLAVPALAWALWGADPWSATAGGLVWLLAAPVLFPWTLGFDAQILANALLPVVTLATWAVIAGGGFGAVLAGALGLSLALGIQALHGHPQVLVYSSALILAFALQQAWALRRWRRLLPWAAAVALGATIGAAVWWPALLYSGLSSRGGGATSGVAMEVVARYSLAWRDLLSLLWPHAVGFGGATYWGGLQVAAYSPYLGVVAVLFALLGVPRDPERGGARALFWWGVLLGAVACSLGATLGPVFRFLHAHVPFWSKFRSPSYVLVAAVLALALLAARGLARATAEPHSGSGRMRRAAFLAIGALGVAGLALAFPLAGRYAELARALRPALEPAGSRLAALWAGLDLLLRGALVALALALLSPAQTGRRWARPVLLALLVFDLVSIGVPALRRATGPAAAVAPPEPPALARIAAPTGARVYAGAARPVVDPQFAVRNYAEAYTNFWVSWRARCLTGNHGAFPAAWRPAMENQLTRYQSVLRAWGVSWLDLDRAVPAPGLTRIAGDGHGDVYALPGALGRAYAVPEVVWLPDEDAVAGAMALPGFDPAGVAVTTSAGAAGSYPGSGRCVIRWRKDEPEHLALDVAAPAQAFVVVADSWFPGWSATLDGQPVEIAPTDLLVRGVSVPPGRHRLELRYETVGMREGVRATRAGLGAWALLALVGAGRVIARTLARRRPQVRSAAGP
jgi:hypothetical protein